MAALVRAFRASLRSVVFRQSQGNIASASSSTPSASIRGSEGPCAVGSNAEESVECLAVHAEELGRQNPAALAQLTAYLEVIKSVDSLYEKYRVAECKDEEDPVERAARRVGLRLPEPPTDMPEAAGSGGS